MLNDPKQVEAMIRRDVAVMQQQLVQTLQQRDALTAQAERLHASIQEWSAQLADDPQPETAPQ